MNLSTLATITRNFLNEIDIIQRITMTYRLASAQKSLTTLNDIVQRINVGNLVSPLLFMVFQGSTIEGNK